MGNAYRRRHYLIDGMDEGPIDPNQEELSKLEEQRDHWPEIYNEAEAKILELNEAIEARKNFIEELDKFKVDPETGQYALKAIKQVRKTAQAQH